MPDNTSRAQPTSQTSKGQPSGYGHSEGRARRAGRRKERAGQGEGRHREGSDPPPTSAHPTAAHRRDSQAPTRPAKEAYEPIREGVCPRACATAQSGKEHAPHAGQAGQTGSTRHQHHGRHQRPTTRKPEDQAPQFPQCNSRRPNGHVSTRQQTRPLPATKKPPPRWTCARPAVNAAPAGYETAAVRMDVCAPGSEPSFCRLRNRCRTDGRVCARQ